MKHLLPLLLLATSAFAATPDWENEQVTGINKESSRVFSLPFADRREALDSHHGPWANAAEITPVLVK